MKSTLAILLIAGLPLSAADAPKGGGIKIEAPNVSMKFGALLQPQFEASEHHTNEGTKQDFFVRRARLLWGGSIGKSFSFFVETDSSNLGKSASNGAKGATFKDIKIQDIVLSYKMSDNWTLDGGLLLVPSAHLSNQGATSLNGHDYSPYAFLQSGHMDNSAGRDTGIMARGIFFNKHVQFKLGAFQGKREEGNHVPHGQASRNPMRVAGRLQFNILGNEDGLFLSGTYGGAKDVLAIGVAHDRQGDYEMTAFDAFMDLKVGNDVITAQFDHWSHEGKEGFWYFAKRKAMYGEVSYRFKAVELAPIFRYEKLTMDVPTAGLPDETRTGAGLAWWFMGHNSNLKLFWQKVKTEAPGMNYKDYNQFTAQWQMFYF